MEENFKENGFIILRNVIPLDKIERSLSEIEELVSHQYFLYNLEPKVASLDEKLIALFNLDKIYRKHLHDAITYQMLSPSEIGLFLKKFLNKVSIEAPVAISPNHVYHLPDEDHFLTEVHQDIGVMLSAKSVTCWYPLLPVNKENGRLRLYPGSHKLGVVVPYKNNYRGHSLINPEIINQFEPVEFDMEPSDLLIFSTSLFHSSSPNRSNNCRFASIIRFEDYAEQEFHGVLESRFKEGYTMIRDNTSPSGFKENIDDLKNDQSKVASQYKEMDR